MAAVAAVAAFTDIHSGVLGHVTFRDTAGGAVIVQAEFTALPSGEHGFHIHKSGDLRAPGCAGACDHFHKGHPTVHGGPPGASDAPRHTGDLGNVGKTGHIYRYRLPNLRITELLGRTVIIHADQDDLGKGTWPDSHTTGHAGTRIACAIIGRISSSNKRVTRRTRKYL